MSQKQIIVIGAGASGMTAAISAARAGASVTLLDGMKKPGRKLLLTGSGKCNLTTLSSGLPGAYRSLCGSPSDVAGNILRSFGVRETLAFFEELGLAARAQGDLVYPRSGQAQTVLSALLRELEHLRVKMKFNSKVTAISFEPASHKWRVSTDGWTYEADAVILCCGSKAAPSTGSDGSGYRLAEMAHHPVTPIHAALTGLICADPALKQCAGARTRARVRLTGAEAAPDAAHPRPKQRSKQLPNEDTGEVQWTEYGISGIVVFQLSRLVPELSAALPLSVSIDLAPELTEEEIAASMTKMIHHFAGRITIKQLLEGYTHDRVAAYLSSRFSKDHMLEAAAHLAALLKDVRLTVTGVRSFDHAQVCAGGVALDAINPETLESRLTPGLFFAGELLDIDGPCGGYNLQWAWSSGWVAGRSAAR